jgi:hypothetical protein
MLDPVVVAARLAPQRLLARARYRLGVEQRGGDPRSSISCNVTMEAMRG